MTLNIYTEMANELISNGADSVFVNGLCKEDLDSLHEKSLRFGRNPFAELMIATRLKDVRMIDLLKLEISVLKSFDNLHEYR